MRRVPVYVEVSERLGVLGAVSRAVADAGWQHSCQCKLRWRRCWPDTTTVGCRGGDEELAERIRWELRGEAWVLRRRPGAATVVEPFLSSAGVFGAP